MSSWHRGHDTFRGGVISPRRLRFVFGGRWPNLVLVVGGVWVGPSFCSVLFCSVLRIGRVCAQHTFRFTCIWIGRSDVCYTYMILFWLVYVASYISVLFWARYEITPSHLISAYYFIMVVLFIYIQFSWSYCSFQFIILYSISVLGIWLLLCFSSGR